MKRNALKQNLGKTKILVVYIIRIGIKIMFNLNV